MITYFQAIALGALQGVTELFPISSLGHSVLLPPLLGWRIDQGADYFLVFLVATHIATSLVLLAFYWREWASIVKGIFRSLARRYIDPADTHAKLGWLIVVATVPAGALGILFEKSFQSLFASPRYVAVFLLLNGLVLFGAEAARKRRALQTDAPSRAAADDAAIARLTWSQAVKVGFAQSMALLPGFSRTGTTMMGGLLTGLDHADAARFAFLLATPVIFAAGVLKLPELLVPGQHYPIGPIAAGAAAAAIGAYASVRFLVRYFRARTLVPFAVYCVIVGALSSLAFFGR
ncbi:MAG: undecaprenyl-diphosphate phosphatase [Patescibacteria group bacterium]|nr:undecaprenyl-diphosphate phosphatase [Patescibacteria group bacterium]